MVVTGLGAVTPVGKNVAQTWDALIAGKSGIARIAEFDPSNLETQFAGEVKEWDPQAYFNRKEARRLDRAVQFAAVAAREAAGDAGLELEDGKGERASVIIGTAIGTAWTIYNQVLDFAERGPRHVSPLFVAMGLPDTAAAQVAMELGATGLNLALASACATGANAIGEGSEVIRRGDADIVIAGGTEAGILPVVVAGFNNMKALSTYNRDPAGACRPFDAMRDGFVLSEGAGVVVLERFELAQARGAHIYGEIAGYGSTVDAMNWAAPMEGGKGIARTMARAFERSGLRPEDINYINAHGTATRLNDRTETEGIKQVFGERAYRVPVSSTKSMTGHMMGAAGAVEAIACLKAMQVGMIPPTINYAHCDPECDLDYVPNIARPARIDVAMSNSIGIGGHNATLILSRVE